MLASVRPVALAVVLVVAAGLSCSEKRPPPLQPAPRDAGPEGSIGVDVDTTPCEGAPPPDAAGFCGNEIVEVLTEKPSVYFALDASGSMQDEFEGSSVSKLLSAKLAIKDVLLQIGHRVRYGAAIYPDNQGEDACAPGIQVFPTTQGDPVYCGDASGGPVLSRFLDNIGFRQAAGGTPTSATLAALAPTLRVLGAKTSVVLITDGAPNCNPGARCDADSCIPNLERALLGDRVCGKDVDCCDPDVLPEARRNCVDDTQSENVLSSLAEDGIRTFVIGLPGSETYADVLDGMAEAGGTARLDADTKYFSVSDTSDLSSSLFTIGAEVSLDCQIQLQKAPPDTDLVNVYFDSEPVQLDEENGWSYGGDATIELHGESCDVLKGGAVTQLQIVAGCPTIVK